MLISVPAPEPRPTQIHTPTVIIYNILQETGPYQPDLPLVIKRNFESPLDAAKESISELQNRTYGWDGHNAPVPNHEAIHNAILWIEQAFSEVADKATVWRDPYVSSDEVGNVTLEWWNGSRKLTVYVTPEIVEYVQVWGPDIISEMSDGELTRDGQWRTLWSWLHTA